MRRRHAEVAVKHSGMRVAAGGLMTNSTYFRNKCVVLIVCGTKSCYLPVAVERNHSAATMRGWSIRISKNEGMGI
jgi:hypothetical protein